MIAALVAFCWFIAWRTHYDPTVTATVVTAVVAIVIGFLAAYMGARATLRAAHQEHQSNLELQQETRATLVRGVVQSIYAELATLWEIYRDEFGEEWDNHCEDDAFLIYYPLNQDYFTVYNANSAFIGQIPDEELRAAIIRAYLRAKGLIDSHLLNNKLLDEHTRLTNAMSGSTDDIEKKIADDAFNELVNYGKGIRSAYEEAKSAILSVLTQIENLGMVKAKPRPLERSTNL